MTALTTQPEPATSRVGGFADRAIGWAESGRLPDWVVRLGMDRVIASRLSSEFTRGVSEREAFRQEAWSGPVAIRTDEANEQHYEVPGEFFDLVLGPRRKYSSAWWPMGTSDLAAAEDAMLSLTAGRAGLSDGQRILDLGCGWGPFTFWAASHYPKSEIVAVSNSSGQRRHILDLAERSNFENITVITADVNDFDAPGRFDRIVSVEMLEHVRNHRAVFERARGWLDPDGAFFVQVFAHRFLEYPFESEGPGSWMARTFFTGGLMPSPHWMVEAARTQFDLAGKWWLDGMHYSRTLEAWLDLLDSRIAEVRQVLRPVYGDDLEIWIQRWRMFFMACSQMFRYRSSSEWGVSHLLFRPA